MSIFIFRASSSSISGPASSNDSSIDFSSRISGPSPSFTPPQCVVEELPVRRKVARSSLPLLEQGVGESAEPLCEDKEVIVVFKVGAGYTTQGLAGHKLKDKTAKAPYIEGFIVVRGGSRLAQDQLGSP